MRKSSCETDYQNVGKELFKVELVFIGTEAVLLIWRWLPGHPFGPVWRLCNSFCVGIGERKV